MGCLTYSLTPSLVCVGSRVEEDSVAEVPFTPDSAAVGKSGERGWEWATGVRDSTWRSGGVQGARRWRGSSWQPRGRSMLLKKFREAVGGG